MLAQFLLEVEEVSSSEAMLLCDAAFDDSPGSLGELLALWRMERRDWRLALPPPLVERLAITGMFDDEVSSAEAVIDTRGGVQVQSLD